jgi:hypothetical protein
MAFADVIRKQRSGGKGVFGSLSSAATESLKEKMDPRNLLDQKGVLTALFPGLKSYKTKQVERSSRRIATGPSLVSVNNDTLNAMNEKLDFIGKNTMSLPIMMRDINVMRQSMIKLVKLQGGEQKDSADKFFKTSAEQEKLYENTLKSKKGSTAPTKVGGEAKTSSLGSLAFMATVFLGVLGAYFTSPEFKEKVDNLIGGLVKSVFGETTFSDLVTGITAAIGALAVLKLSFMAFDTFMKTMMTRLGAKVFGPGAPVPTPGDVPDVDKDKDKAKGKGKPKYGTIQDRPKGNLDKAKELASKARGAMNATNFARMGVLGLLVGEAYMLYKLIESDSHETKSQSDVEHGIPGSWSPEEGFTAEGGPIDTDNIKGLSSVPNYVDPSGAKAEQKRLSNYKPTPVQKDGVSMLERIMDSEGITDPDTRARIIALAKIESSLNPNAKGPIIRSEKSMHFGDQAHGLLQIMPKTAEEMGFSRSDLQDPEKAALAGVRYFMKNLNRFNGSLDAATIAHHSGPGGAKKFLETGDSGTTDVATGLKTSDYLTKVSGAQVAMSGGAIGSSAVSLADARTEMAKNMPPVVINSPQTVNNMSQSGSSNMITASVLDEEFARLLFERAVV